MNSVGKRIKQLRLRQGWSQLELADKLQLNNSVLSRIETGKRAVEDVVLLKSAELFQVSADFLLGRPSEHAREGKAPYMSSSSEDTAFWEELRKVAFEDSTVKLSNEQKQLMMEALLDTARTTRRIIEHSFNI